jgi:hypothetical protein
LAILCVPILAACATGFGSPTRHAIANLQATSIDVGPDLKIDGLIIALPDGSTAAKGGVAYIEFNATNLAGQDDQLQNASVTAVSFAVQPASSGSAASSAPASAASPASSASPTPSDVSSQVLPVGPTTIPKGSLAAPGVARLVVALEPLTQPLSQGQSVRVSLQFANAGSVDDVLVPVQGGDVVGSSFLPSAPPSLPSSASPGAVSSGSAASSAPASAPASGSPSAAASS